VRDHDECEEAIAKAMREDRPGKAEFLAARCDLWHGHIATPGPPPVRPTTAAVAAEEAGHG